MVRLWITTEFRTIPLFFATINSSVRARIARSATSNTYIREFESPLRISECF